MTINRAYTILKKEMTFLGMTFNEVLKFIERNPYAVPQSVIEAYEAYNRELPAE